MIHYYRATVAGSGYFPLDMLRYDRCWPSKEIEITSIAGSDSGLRVPREVHVTTCREGKWLPDEQVFTDARWRSFGWRVVNVERTV